MESDVNKTPAAYRYAPPPKLREHSAATLKTKPHLAASAALPATVSGVVQCCVAAVAAAPFKMLQSKHNKKSTGLPKTE